MRIPNTLREAVTKYQADGNPRLLEYLEFLKAKAWLKTVPDSELRLARRLAEATAYGRWFEVVSLGTKAGHTAVIELSDVILPIDSIIAFNEEYYRMAPSAGGVNQGEGNAPPSLANADVGDHPPHESEGNPSVMPSPVTGLSVPPKKTKRGRRPISKEESRRRLKILSEWDYARRQGQAMKEFCARYNPPLRVSELERIIAWKAKRDLRKAEN